MEDMNDRPPLNEKLISCVLDHIERHPDEYNQNMWCRLMDQNQDGEFCGTAGCFAGWAVLLSTPVAKWKDMHDYCQKVDSWDTRAARLLGLTEDEQHLFNSVPESYTPQMATEVIKARLNAIRKGRGLPMVDYGAAAVAKVLKGDDNANAATE